jgi:putative membrane protein
MYTRFAFLGLVIGTIPLFNKEVKKHGFDNKYYIAMGISFILGIFVLFMNRSLVGEISDPNFFQSILLGFTVAGSTIVPGVDSAVILSSLGLYEIYVNSISNLNFEILIPAAIGLGVGAILISYGVNKLLKKYYTITFSIIFGLFIAIIPSVLNDSCKIGYNFETAVSFIFVIVGFLISYFLGKIKK